MQGVECYKQMAEHVDLTSLVIKHSPLIKKIANHIRCRLPPHIELDDLMQAGLIGLIEAQKKFDAEKGASFETYAAIKIRAAIIDELRVNTGITRQISDNIKKISLAKATLESKYQNDKKMISAGSIAEEMGITFGKYSSMVAEIDAYKSMSLGDITTVDDMSFDERQNPPILAEKDEIRGAIKTVLAGLPKREQQILALYYNEQLSFKEIADILNLTEARISQLHLLSLANIKKKFNYRYGTP